MTILKHYKYLAENEKNLSTIEKNTIAYHIVSNAHIHNPIEASIARHALQIVENQTRHFANVVDFWMESPTFKYKTPFIKLLNICKLTDSYPAYLQCNVECLIILYIACSEYEKLQTALTLFKNILGKDFIENVKVCLEEVL